MTDAFSRCHPAVNFIFFAVAIVLSVAVVHPAYLAVSALCAAAYYLALRGRRAVRVLLGFLPVFAVLSAVNPLFNTLGQHILFTCRGRPYTLEALYYGMAIAAMFVGVMLWFLCCGIVMTSDKFTALFAPLLPALSLLLVMILRLIPAYRRKGRQISGARQCVGKGVGQSRRDKLTAAGTTLSALTGWALEGAVITADSMRARGYGAARRSSFQIYRFTRRDALLIAAMTVLTAAVILSAAAGGTSARFTPVLDIAPLSGIRSAAALAAYGAMLLLPTIMQIKEVILWHISISDI